MKFGLELYYSKPRKYRYQGSFAWVHPEVFPPRLTFSTRVLLDFMKAKDLSGKSLLELGCGSGIISLYAASKGARVTATDINKTALEFLQKSADGNNCKLDILESDLFENLEGKSFDLIVINPPYYPKNARTIKEMAWFCGEHFEYFEGLFAQLPRFMTPVNDVLMILSQDCQVEQIKGIAGKNKIGLQLLEEKTVLGEKNYLFKLKGC